MSKSTKKQDLVKLAQKVNKKIAEDNAKFKAMNAEEKRVAIARDVLAQLKAEKLIARAGTFLTGQNGDNIVPPETDKDEELQTILQNTEVCEGCAIGGMFMCAVKKANKLKVGSLESFDFSRATHASRHGLPEITEDDAFNYLSKFFSRNQLDMIETAFEFGDGARSSDDASADFVRDIEDDSERMRLIMENIVVNKGKFVPKNKPIIGKVVEIDGKKYKLSLV